MAKNRYPNIILRLIKQLREREKWQEYLCFGLIWVPYALLVKYFWFLTDDAFISFRFARNWALGHGLRYNLWNQTPVEGYSNFLWVVWEGIIEFLGGDLAFWIPLSSFLAGSILLYLLFITLRRRFQLPLVVCFLTLLSLAVFPPFTVWSTSGLATVPFALVMFLTFERLILRRKGPAAVSAGIAGLVLALIRAEGAAWSILIGFVALLSWWLASSGKEKKKISFRPLLIYYGITLVGTALYYAWRYTYYQEYADNIVSAKVSINLFTLGRGFDYTCVYYLTFLTPFLIFPAIFIIFGKGIRSVGIPIQGMAIAVTCYAIVVSGDFMAMGRLFIIGLPFTTLLFGFLLNKSWEQWHSRFSRIVGSSIALICLVIALLPGVDVHLVPEKIRKNFHFRHNSKEFRSEFKQWRYMKDNSLNWTKLGKLLKHYASPGESLVRGPFGAVGYYSNLLIYDNYGLVTPEVVSNSVPAENMRSPGHDKSLPFNYFLKYNPTYIFVYLAHPTEVLGIAGMLFEKSVQLSGMGYYYVPKLYAIDGGDMYLIVHKLIADANYIEFRQGMEEFSQRIKEEFRSIQTQ